jgi:hypothetical protein
MNRSTQFRLMKSEPEVDSIDHLQLDGVTSWNRVLFDHSSTGLTGGEVTEQAGPQPLREPGAKRGV